MTNQADQSSHCPDLCSIKVRVTLMSARSGDMERSLFTVCALILVLGVAVHSASGTSRRRVKPGVCPSTGWSSLARPCQVKCTNDYQCPGKSKCCRQGCHRLCREPVKPGVCPSFSWSGTLRPCRNSCSNDRQCPGPSKCCRLGCGRVCLVPNGVKPGVCPSTGWSSLARPCQVKCTKDYQCPGKCKCCRQGCHRLCREPVVRIIKPGSCPRVNWSSVGRRCANRCSQDSQCPGRQKCCRVGCGRRCVRPTVITIIKPGRCPRVNWSSVGRPCRNRCSQDSQCPGRQKCCRVRCGRRCAAPIVIRFIKPGRCPPVKWSNVGTRCPNLCSQDSQCRGRQKCCRVGCGRRCVRPIVITNVFKPGSCPPVNWSRVGRPCANLCSQDSNCPGIQKCCNAGCGRRCLVPLVPGGNGETLNARTWVPK